MYYYYLDHFISEEKEQKLKKIAEEILSSVMSLDFTTSPPINLDKILEKFRIQLFVMQKGNKNYETVDSMMIFSKEVDKEVSNKLYISERLMNTRNFNYSIAFHIGKSIVNSQIQSTYLLKDMNYSKNDIEAMIFAQYLLIPDVLLSFIITNDNYERMSKLIGVPRFLIETRLERRISLEDNRLEFKLL